MSKHVKDFQKQNALVADGILGRNTARMMMQRFSIPYVEQMAHFLGNIHHETGGFKIDTENMNYSEERIMQVWPSRFKTIKSAVPYSNNPRALANKVYGGRMGNSLLSNDGWYYRGRGALQLTGKSAYSQFQNWLSANGLLKDPAHNVLVYPDIVASEYFWETALFYFTRNSLWPISRSVDPASIRKVRKSVNGGYIGIDDVTAKVNYYYNLLK